MIYTFLIGLLIGIVAKMLMPGRDPGGFIITAIIGIVGSVAGSYMGQILGLTALASPLASSCRSSALCCSFGVTGCSPRLTPDTQNLPPLEKKTA